MLHALSSKNTKTAKAALELGSSYASGNVAAVKQVRWARVKNFNLMMRATTANSRAAWPSDRQSKTARCNRLTTASIQNGQWNKYTYCTSTGHPDWQLGRIGHFGHFYIVRRWHFKILKVQPPDYRMMSNFSLKKDIQIRDLLYGVQLAVYIFITDVCRIPGTSVSVWQGTVNGDYS